MNAAAQETIQLAKPFRKVVVWGLKRQWHSHRFIHHAFFRTLKHLGIPAVWTDFNGNPDIIEKGDLVITSNVYGRGTSGSPLAPFRQGAYYCFHGFDHSGYDGGDRMARHEVDRKFCLNLEVFLNRAEASSDKWDSVTYFDKPSKTLHQPWGTSLMAEEFYAPKFSSSSFIFWVGAIWNNELNQGNRASILELKQVLKQHSLRFIHLKFVPDFVGISAVRLSRLAPAIAGQWQVDNNYLPCRMFKNISYGRLGFSNVPKFAELYKDCTLPGNSITELVNNALSLNKSQVLELTAAQQVVTQQHTYVQKLGNIFRAMLAD